MWNCYVLAVESRETCSVSLGERPVVLGPGVYFYVGSARGPGGALARVARHLSRTKRVWWHIDRLLACPGINVRAVYLLRAERCDCEFEVSSALRRVLLGIPGFGASDKKRDYSHLYECSDDLADCLVRVYELLESVACISEVLYAEPLIT
ncbi:MAG: GIY-YIG nuclease family protein [Desulfurococcaceae archaeon]|nr:GIY-YIG nuclease family protein [Desulfurococcaceae archaeon]